MENKSEKRAIKGRNGGTIYPFEKGQKALPGSGRPRNPFKETIRRLADDGGFLDVTGVLLDGNGDATDQKVRVRVLFPAVEAVVRRMYKLAAKGRVPAAKWLVETGFGRTVNLANDEENPIGGGFAVLLPDNSR